MVRALGGNKVIIEEVIRTAETARANFKLTPCCLI
jgi:hypothetical protein